MHPAIMIPMMMSGGVSATTIAPVTLDIASDGVTLTVTYGEALDTAYQSATASWAVTVAGVLRAVDAVSVPGGATVVLTLASPVFVGQTATLTYAQGANAVRSLADGHLAANFGPSIVDTTAAWSPASIAGLTLLGDVDQWTDTAGALTSAPDASGEGNSLTVSGSVTRTASDPNFNGHASVTSAGGYLDRDAFVGGPLSPFTIYVVTRATGAGLGFMFGDGDDGAPRVRVSAAGLWGVLSPNQTGPTFVEGQVGVFRLRSAGGNCVRDWRPFGAAENSASVASANTLAGLSLLANSIGGTPYSGPVALVIVYGDDVNGAPDATLMSYLTRYQTP